MKPVLFMDTNILIDLLGMRNPFHAAAEQIVSLADQDDVRLVSTALSFVNVDYILKKAGGADLSIEKLRKFKILCTVVPTTDLCVEKALNSNFTNFEDAVQYFSALEAEASLIISRDSKGFKNSAIPVLTAEEFIETRLLNP